MDYTKNFHLPQWVRSDRILMEDFNDAMANIENGLVGVRKGLSDSDSACALAETRAWDALLRTGRGSLEDCLEQLPRDGIYSRNGLLFNPLSSAEMADAMSGTQWHETMGVWAGRGAYLPDDVLRSCSNGCQVGSTGLSHVFPSAESYFAFTAPVTGTIESFNLYLYIYFNSSNPQLVMNLDFIVERISGSSSVELSRRKLHIEREGLSIYWEELPVVINLPITKGTKYRLRLVPTSSASILGHYGFLTSAEEEGKPSGVTYTKFKILNPPSPSAVHTRSFPTEGAASHALAVMRYRKEEDASTISIALDGTDMTRVSEQTVPGRDGENCLEAWYTCEGSYKGNAQVRISLNSTNSDDLRLLEYAVMLL